MNRKLLLESCKTLAAAGVWCIPESTLSACAGYPDKLYLRVALTRHVNAGLIERLGPKPTPTRFSKRHLRHCFA